MKKNTLMQIIPTASRLCRKTAYQLLTGPASPSNAMTSPLLAFKRPRRTAGTSSPLKWMAT